MLKTASFFCTEGNSDKEYHLSIVEAGSDLFKVSASYGRRGGPLKGITKNNHPVDIESATKLFDKLVKERLSKGYKPAESNHSALTSGVSVTVPDGKLDSGIRLQLLNPVEDEQAAMRLIKDDLFFAQQKYDGVRKAIIKENGAITFVNKTGFQTSGNNQLVECLLALETEDFILDGEDMGSKVVVFDILKLGSADLRKLPADKRYSILIGLFAGSAFSKLDCVQLATACFTKEQKLNLFKAVRENNYEGVVFKRCASLYAPGRPASGGDQLKYKFVESASLIVTAVNGKRSVQLGLYNCDGEIEHAGNVTIPINKEIPQAGQVVECRYLYANKSSNVIFQPVYLGVREDVPLHECTTNQLKFKNTDN